MRCFYVVCVAILSLAGCELYQSAARQCFQDPNKKGCERLDIDLSQALGERAQRHCMFGRGDVEPIRGEREPTIAEGLNIWNNGRFLNVEVSSGGQPFNCVFSPANLEEGVYIPMTYELVSWLLRQDGK